MLDFFQSTSKGHPENLVKDRESNFFLNGLREHIQSYIIFFHDNVRSEPFHVVECAVCIPEFASPAEERSALDNVTGMIL